MTARLEAVFCCCFSREGGERKKKRIEKAKGETESVRKKTSFFLSRVSASNRNREKETSFWLTEGVGGGPVLEHLVRLKPLRDAGGAGLGRDRREQDPRDGRHRDAAVDELGVGEPLEDLRVGAEAERVEAVVAREGAVEVGRGGVSCWRERGLGREGEKKQFFFSLALLNHGFRSATVASFGAAAAARPPSAAAASRTTSCSHRPPSAAPPAQAHPSRNGPRRRCHGPRSVDRPPERERALPSSRRGQRADNSRRPLSRDEHDEHLAGASAWCRSKWKQTLGRMEKR